MHLCTVRKRIRILCGILIQDGDRSVTLQTIIAYFSSKSAFKLKNHVPMNQIEPPLHPETHKWVELCADRLKISIENIVVIRIPPIRDYGMMGIPSCED